MITHNNQPILEVLEKLSCFNPVKICFNDKELYNDYDSSTEIVQGLCGEIEPYMTAVPKRLKEDLEKYDIWVEDIEILLVQYHHSLVYLKGQKIRKGYYD